MEYYLYHHGIAGQKWGKRNGPPYPLDASDHSSSEKKAGWKKSLDKKDNSDNSDKSKEKWHLSDKQKKAIKIGAAAVGTALLAYGAYKFSQSEKFGNLIKAGKRVAYKTLNHGYSASQADDEEARIWKDMLWDSACDDYENGDIRSLRSNLAGMMSALPHLQKFNNTHPGEQNDFDRMMSYIDNNGIKIREKLDTSKVGLFYDKNKPHGFQYTNFDYYDAVSTLEDNFCDERIADVKKLYSLLFGKW